MNNLPLPSSALTQNPYVTRSFHRLLAAFVILLAVLLMSSTASAVAAGPYIQLNNGQSISITGTEQPQIVVQFGNTGASVNDVRVRCQWDNFIRFTGQAQNGPFSGAVFSPPAGGALAQINWPATTVTDPASLPNLPSGQNYNVGFNIRLALPSPGFKGSAGNLQCFLFSANFTLLASSPLIPVNVR